MLGSPSSSRSTSAIARRGAPASASGVGGGEGGAVERGGGGVEQRELAAWLEVGEVDEQVGAFGRREHEAVRGHTGGGPEQSVVGADLGDPVELGLIVPE